MGNVNPAWLMETVPDLNTEILDVLIMCCWILFSLKKWKFLAEEVLFYYFFVIQWLHGNCLAHATRVSLWYCGKVCSDALCWTGYIKGSRRQAVFKLIRFSLWTLQFIQSCANFLSHPSFLDLFQQAKLFCDFFYIVLSDWSVVFLKVFQSWSLATFSLFFSPILVTWSCSTTWKVSDQLDNSP